MLLFKQETLPQRHVCNLTRPEGGAPANWPARTPSDVVDERRLLHRRQELVGPGAGQVLDGLARDPLGRVLQHVAVHPAPRRHLDLLVEHDDAEHLHPRRRLHPHEGEVSDVADEVLELLEGQVELARRPAVTRHAGEPALDAEPAVGANGPIRHLDVVLGRTVLCVLDTEVPLQHLGEEPSHEFLVAERIHDLIRDPHGDSALQLHRLFSLILP